MKIYFAGAVGGELNEDIISLLSEFGEVLTDQEEIIDSAYTYERHMELISQADFVVAEISESTLEIGYEIGIAESLDKKILCLYREQEDRKLSAMILGNRKLSIASYESLEDISNCLQDFF